MAVSTVADIIRGALQDLGRLTKGETPDANDADIGLERLNGLLDQSAAERLVIFKSARTTWTITQAASFTIGTGGTINTPRPTWIDHVAYEDTSQSVPVEVPLQALTEDGYAAYAMKTETNTVPAAWYYDHAAASGLGNVYLLPIPTGSTLRGVLYAPRRLDSYAAITDSFSLPPGYERFLRTNLAMELAGPFEAAPPPWLVDAAKESKGIVKRANQRPVDLAVDAGACIQAGSSGGRWSIFTDR